MTAPLTPPDCDLRGLPFMPLDVIRLMDSDLFALTTGDEFKAALGLWCKSWTQVPAGSLPDDDRVLAHLSGAGSRWKKVKDQALRNWVRCSDGRFYHPVVCEKVMEALPYRQAHAEKKTADAERKARERDDRKALFALLKAHGHVMNYDTSTKDLRAKARELGLQDVRPPVTDESVTPVTPVTLPVTAKTGTGTIEEGSVSNETGADAPSSDPFLARFEGLEPRTKAWRMTKAVLVEQGGMNPSRAGGLVGKLVSDNDLSMDELISIAEAAYHLRTEAPEPYLTKAAAEVAKRRSTAGGQIAAPSERQQLTWMEDWQRSSATWTGQRGPRPGQPGCRVSAEIQRQFGVEPATPQPIGAAA